MLVKIGFLKFKPELYSKLLDLAAENKILEEQVRETIITTTYYINTLINLPEKSEEFEINAIPYEEFEVLYNSIHEELPKHRVPIYLVAGFVIMKDPNVPGYVAFSLPLDYMNDPNSVYSFKEFLMNAAHERFERFLLKETIIAKVYEKAREDYHERYTLNKKRNSEAFILYALNKSLIPLQETITYAVTYLVNEFLEANHKFSNNILLPLIEREFRFDERKRTANFMESQFKGAQIDVVGPDIAHKRLNAGLKVLHLVTEKFQEVCNDFLKYYSAEKSKGEGEIHDFFQAISKTIQKVLNKHGLTDILALYEEEYAKI